MSAVTNYFREIELQVWRNTEKMAFEKPVARLLAIPITIGFIVRFLLFSPARFVEEIVLTGKSIKIYITEKRSTESLSNKDSLFHLGNDIHVHSLKVFYYGITTILSPLVALIKAIVLFIKMGTSPFKTAKINIARQVLNEFLEKKSLNCDRSVSFAESAFNRFKQTVERACNDEETKNVHFLDQEDSENELVNEIKSKENYFKLARKDYLMNMRGIADGDDFESNKIGLVKLEKLWKEFENQLIAATLIEVSEMKFNPIIE